MHVEDARHRVCDIAKPPLVGFEPTIIIVFCSFTIPKQRLVHPWLTDNAVGGLREGRCCFGNAKADVGSMIMKFMNSGNGGSRHHGPGAKLGQRNRQVRGTRIGRRNGAIDLTPSPPKVKVTSSVSRPVRATVIGVEASQQRERGGFSDIGPGDRVAHIADVMETFEDSTALAAEVRQVCVTLDEMASDGHQLSDGADVVVLSLESSALSSCRSNNMSLLHLVSIIDKAGTKDAFVIVSVPSAEELECLARSEINLTGVDLLVMNEAAYGRYAETVASRMNSSPVSAGALRRLSFEEILDTGVRSIIVEGGSFGGTIVALELDKTRERKEIRWLTHPFSQQVDRVTQPGIGSENPSPVFVGVLAHEVGIAIRNSEDHDLHVNVLAFACGVARVASWFDEQNVHCRRDGALSEVERKLADGAQELRNRFLLETRGSDPKPSAIERSGSTSHHRTTASAPFDLR